MAKGQEGGIRLKHGAAVLLVFLTGCLASRDSLDRALVASRAPARGGDQLTSKYVIHCPDVLDVAVVGLGKWSGPRRVGAEGRLDFGDAGRLRVDGLTAPAVARVIAEALNVSVQQVQVNVLEYNSQQVYLHGEVQAQQRAVPYRGPETVVDLLQRVGGLSADAAPRHIQVVRGNVADGGPPEVFHVNLEAIYLKNDPRTNMTLEPFDQIYVGQSRRSGLTQALPPWLRPFGETLFGIHREKAGQLPSPGSPPGDRLPASPILPPNTMPAPKPVPDPLRLATQ